jgi:hypothetical protein
MVMAVVVEVRMTRWWMMDGGSGGGGSGGDG